MSATTHFLFRRLFDHLAWADALAYGEVSNLPSDAPQRARAITLYAHIAAAEHVWLARLRGRAPEYAVWPDLEPAAARALAGTAAAGFREYIDALAVTDGSADPFGTIVSYHNSRGDAFTNSIADVLTHVALHGSYHRGQLALLARDASVTPMLTDYIAFVRDAPLSRENHP